MTKAQGQSMQRSMVLDSVEEVPNLENCVPLSIISDGGPAEIIQ